MKNLLTLIALIVLPMTIPLASAQELPLLVLRLEAEHGFTLDNRKAGLSGTIYVLSHSAQRSIQIAYDARNRPVLLRLVVPVGGDADLDSIPSLAQKIARLALPDWETVEPDLDAAVSNLLQHDTINGTAGQSAGQTVPQTLSVPGSDPVTLNVLAEESVAIFDFPVTASDSEALTESELNSIIYDATLISDNSNATAIRRYHAPDGRFGGVASDTAQTGSWSLTADGQYCVEIAPVSGMSCAQAFKTGANSYLLILPDTDDASEAPRIQAFSMTYGNPDGFVVPRRADATPSAVTKMIITGQTEERRRPEGGIDRLFLDTSGQFRGFQNGAPIIGHWSVLRDGRRCLIGPANQWECAFLSETDGGTFRTYDAKSTFLGEALYHDGNPNNF